MKMISPIMLGMSLALASGPIAAAQDAAAPALPKIMQITREYIKAGKAGQLHDKSESAFVAAMAKAKFPTHYVALNSMSGKSRAIYLTNYPSFEAWGNDNKSVEKNAALSAELERATVADGDLLDSIDQAILVSSEEMSFHPKPGLAAARYMEISTYHVKPGHTREWREAVKLVKDAYEKAGTSAHWGMFQLLYGGDGDTYLVFSSKTSMAELDTGFADSKKFQEAAGEDGLKKLDELVQASVESTSHQLFSVNPKQSYVDEAWIKDDPDFWKPKMKASPETAAKPAAKPATAAPKPSSR